VVDCDHSLRTLREELGKRSFTRAEVGDCHRRHELQQGLRQPFPASARNVIAAELSGQLIEVSAYLVAALFEHQVERPRVILRFGDLAGGGVDEIQKMAVADPVKAVLALTS